MQRKLVDIAKNLDLPLGTLDRWIRQGSIPVRRRGEDGIFDETALRKWARKHHLSFARDREADPLEPETREDALLTAMRRGGVFHGLAGDDVASVLASAVQVVPLLQETTRGVLYDRLLEREELTSTGIGNGVAIPHPRSPVIGETDEAVITSCFLERPVDFAAIDDKPVFILFLLMSPSVKIHLQLLSRLAFCVRHRAFVDFLKTRPGADELYAQVAEFEARLED